MFDSFVQFQLVVFFLSLSGVCIIWPSREKDGATSGSFV